MITPARFPGPGSIGGDVGPAYPEPNSIAATVKLAHVQSLFPDLNNTSVASSVSLFYRLFIACSPKPVMLTRRRSCSRALTNRQENAAPMKHQPAHTLPLDHNIDVGDCTWLEINYVTRSRTASVRVPVYSQCAWCALWISWNR